MRLRIKEAREKAGYAQKDLADLVGVKPTTFNGYECGKHDPKSDLLVKIANVCGVTVDYLLGVNIKTAPSISDEALRLAKDYDTMLDDRGRRMARGLTDLEIGYTAKRAEKEKAERKAALLKHKDETAEEITVHVTTLYYQPVSAGNGETAEYGYSETVQLKKMPPSGTSYIVPVRGDSMEPEYNDGDRVFVRAQIDIEPGQIGVFYMDGQLWIKELGDDVLLSHNPKYPPRPMTDDVRCQGLVLGVCDESYFAK